MPQPSLTDGTETMRNDKSFRTTMRLSLVVLVVSACASAVEPEPEPEPARADASPGFRIELESSRCFGACSAYEVTLNEAGTITWNGKQFVEHEGQASATVPPAKAQALWTRLDEYYRESWEPAKWPRCSIGGSDAGAVTISLVRSGNTRKLRREAVCVDGPLIQDLIELEKQIRELTGVQRWIGERKVYKPIGGAADPAAP